MSPNRCYALEMKPQSETMENVMIRIARTFCVIVLLVLVTGCPSGPSFALGLWLFSVDESTLYIGTAFLPNGEMDEFSGPPYPPGSDGIFTGVLTWQQTGNSLTVSQIQMNGSGRTYAGTLENSTYMTGTWTNINDANDTGSFVASKAPSN